MVVQGDTLDYLGVPGLHVAGAQGVLIIALSQFLLMVSDTEKSSLFFYQWD